MTPIAKIITAKQAVQHASEVIEAFGGNGYIENTQIPKLLRDAQVFPIWEGTTNILSLDVLRAEKKHRSLQIMLEHLYKRLDALKKIESNDLQMLRHQLNALHELVSFVLNASDDELFIAYAKNISIQSGLIFQGVLLAEAILFESAVDKKASLRFSHFVGRHFLNPLQKGLFKHSSSNVDQSIKHPV